MSYFFMSKVRVFEEDKCQSLIRYASGRIEKLLNKFENDDFAIK